MKALIVTLLAVPGILSAQTIAHRVEIQEISSQIQLTPSFEPAGIKGKRFDPRHWLEIEAELEVETTEPSGFIPELEAEWFAIIKDDRTGDPIMVTGKFTFRDVRAKGKKAHLIAFVSPDVLEKIAGKERVGEGDIESIALVVSGSGVVNTDRYAAGLEMATSKGESKWWKSGKYKTMPDSILPKQETPFSVLWTDRYPGVKS